MTTHTQAAPQATAAQKPPAESWPEPRALAPTTPKPPPLAPTLIPEPIRDRVVDVAERIGVPVEAVFAPTLVGLGSLIGNTRRIYPKAHEQEWFEIPTFWSMLVAGPSTKKTATIAHALRPLRELEDEMAREFAAGQHRRTATLKSLETQIATKQKQIGAASAKGEPTPVIQALEGDLTKLFEREAEARRSAPRLLVNDVTVEKLGELLAENPKGLVTVRDELNGLLAQMNAVGRENDRPFYLEAYNPGGQYTFDRIGRGTTQVNSVTLSIIGGIQPELVRPLIETAVRTAGGDGFLSRFQLPVLYDLDSAPRDEDRPVNKAAEARAATIFRHLHAKAQAHISDPEKPTPKGLHFEREAQQHMDAWRLNIETRARSVVLSNSPAFQAHLGKAAAFGIRLALLFNAIDEADGKPSEHVTLKQAKDATAIADYYLKHAEAMYEVSSDPGLKVAHYLLDRLENGDFDDYVTTRVIQQKTGKKKGEVLAALATLERHGWVRVRDVANHAARSSTYVSLHPRLLQAKPPTESATTALPS